MRAWGFHLFYELMASKQLMAEWLGPSDPMHRCFCVLLMVEDGL